MLGKPKHELMAQQSAEWFNRNLISSDLAAQLARRYGRRANVFSTPGFRLAVFAAILLFWSNLYYYIGLLSFRLTVEGLLLPFGRAVSTLLVLLPLPVTVLIFVALIIGSAFLFRAAWLLPFGLLLLFYSIDLFVWPAADVWFAMLKGISFGFLFPHPPVMAVTAVFVTTCGLLLRKLEDGRLERFSGFGHIFILFGLFYLNGSLWLLSENPHLLMAFENAQLFAVLLFAAAAIGQIVLGACLKDPIFTGSGIVFLSVNFYTRFFEAFWDRLSQGSFFLVAGLLGMILGYVFELLHRRTLHKSGAGGPEMTPRATNAFIRTELAALRREGVLDSETYRTLRQRHPVETWDWRWLARWFLFFGALGVAAGSMLLARSTIKEQVLGLALLMVAFFAGAQRLRRHAWVLGAERLELLAGLALVWLSLTPSLLLAAGQAVADHDVAFTLMIDLIVLLPFSYALRNRLLLALSVAVFFIGLNERAGTILNSDILSYLLVERNPRYLMKTALLMIGAGALHFVIRSGPLASCREFGKIWLVPGIFIMQVAFLLLVFEGGPVGLVLLFWAAANIVLLALGKKYDFSMLVRYGARFISIPIFFVALILYNLNIFIFAFIVLALALAFLWYGGRRKAA